MQPCQRRRSSKGRRCGGTQLTSTQFAALLPNHLSCNSISSHNSWPHKALRTSMHVHQAPTSALLTGLRCVTASYCLAALTSTLKPASLMGDSDPERQAATGMELPFDPLTLSFHDLCYYVPLPLVIN